MKTSELIGDALGFAVALIEYPEWKEQGYLESLADLHFDDGEYYAPWKNWAQGGPIIEREKISPYYMPGEVGGAWRAEMLGRFMQPGNTPLIAAMRCYCCAKLGGEIEIPQELQPCQQPNP